MTEPNDVDPFMVTSATLGHSPLHRLSAREQEAAVLVVAARVAYISEPVARGAEAARQLGCTTELYQDALDRARSRSRRVRAKDRAVRAAS